MALADGDAPCLAPALRMCSIHCKGSLCEFDECTGLGVNAG
jgi:hypothetical protein